MSSSDNNDNDNMIVLLVVNGFSPADLSASLSNLKSQTKNLGTHKQREAYYKAYQQIQADLNKYSDMNIDGGKLYGLVKYYAATLDEDGEMQESGRTEFEPLTTHQKSLVQTPRCLMGRHVKLLVDAVEQQEDENNAAASGKEFFMPWFGDEAQAAYDDITHGEECISIDSDRGLFISTRLKRKHCAGVAKDVLKSIENLTEYIKSLQPNNPLQSIAWQEHQPPTVKDYNVILTGIWPTVITHHLEPNLATHTNTTSMHEIYDCFVQRRNQHYIDQAEACIAKMLTEINKSHGADDSLSVHVGSMKDLAVAKRNALLKRVFIDESKTKFIQHGNDGGAFDLIVVKSRQGDKGKFEEYGGVVFETFYKLDLKMFG